jgi:hypothetical protein
MRLALYSRRAHQVDRTRRSPGGEMRKIGGGISRRRRQIAPNSSETPTIAALECQEWERISAIRICLCLAVSAALGACGTYVPDISEFPADRVSEQQLVQKIVQGVTCELRDAVNHFYEKQQRQHLFIDAWGAQLTLTLTIDERSELNPTALWTPGIFRLFWGVDVSSDATRIDTINSFHTIQEIRALQSCTPEERPVGPFLLESDLKLENLLFDSQTASDTGHVSFTETAKAGSGKNVIQHEVKFVVISSGNVTPTWKLSRIWSVNPTGVFLSALRNRTQDLLITLGQTDVSGTALAPAAASIALSSQIGIAVSNSVRTATPP